MRNTEPPGMVVSIGFFEGSWSPSLSTGNMSLDQMTQDCAPGRVEITLFTCSSISTLARPCESWPVTTRRIFKLMRFSSLFDGGRGGAGGGPPGSFVPEQIEAGAGDDGGSGNQRHRRQVAPD